MTRARIFLVIAMTFGIVMPALAELSVQGTTRFPQMVELHAPQPGRVARIFVREAESVAVGSILAELDSGVQAARVRVAEVAADAKAQIQRAQVLLEQAQSRQKRIERAAARGGAPKWEVAEARLAVQAATAELAGAREAAVANLARLELEQAGLEQYRVRAPFSGEILEITAREGSLSDGRNPLMVLADRTQVEIVTFIPAGAAFALEIGQAFDASLGAPVSRTVKARLSTIDPRVEPASGTVRAVFVLDVPDMSVPAGIEAVLTLPGSG